MNTDGHGSEKTPESKVLSVFISVHRWFLFTKPGRDIVVIKLIDIFGNDTITRVPVPGGRETSRG